MNHTKGFTLIELAITISIAGLLVAGAMASYNLYLINKKNTLTRENIARVEQALGNFVERDFFTNGTNAAPPDGIADGRRLPCPAPLTTPPGDAQDGRQAAGACVSAGVTLKGAGPAQIAIGAIPYRTINLPREATLDGWGHRLVYAVTTRLADGSTAIPNAEDVPATFAAMGAISAVDESGASVLTPAGRASYVVFSSGKTGNGAYSSAGTLVQPCDTTVQDGQNCDWQIAATSVAAATRFSVFQMAEARTASFSDDKVVARVVPSPAFRAQKIVSECTDPATTLIFDGTKFVCQGLHVNKCPPQTAMIGITNGQPVCARLAIQDGAAFAGLGPNSAWCNWNYTSPNGVPGLLRSVSFRYNETTGTTMGSFSSSCVKPVSARVIVP